MSRACFRSSPHPFYIHTPSYFRLYLLHTIRVSIWDQSGSHTRRNFSLSLSPPPHLLPGVHTCNFIEMKGFSSPNSFVGFTKLGRLYKKQRRRRSDEDAKQKPKSVRPPPTPFPLGARLLVVWGATEQEGSATCNQNTVPWTEYESTDNPSVKIAFGFETPNAVYTITYSGPPYQQAIALDAY